MCSSKQQLIKRRGSFACWLGDLTGTDRILSVCIESRVCGSINSNIIWMYIWCTFVVGFGRWCFFVSYLLCMMSLWSVDCFVGGIKWLSSIESPILVYRMMPLAALLNLSWVIYYAAAIGVIKINLSCALWSTMYFYLSNKFIVCWFV